MSATYLVSIVAAVLGLSTAYVVIDSNRDIRIILGAVTAAVATAVTFGA